MSKQKDPFIAWKMTGFMEKLQPFREDPNSCKDAFVQVAQRGRKQERGRLDLFLKMLP